MANFRCERLFVMLSEPVPGLNHFAAVDPEAFASLFSYDDAQYIDVTPLEDFSYAPYDRPRWHPASRGLASVRALLNLYEKWLSQTPDPSVRYAADALLEKIETLRQLESVLDAADTYDRRFYFKMKDLE